MPKYEFLIRPMERIKSVERDGEDLDYGDSVVVFDERAFFLGIDGHIEALPEGTGDSLDAYFGIELPSDGAALAFVRAFDAMCLDPWRVDFVYRLQDPPDPLVADAEIYAYGDFDGDGAVTI